MPISRPLLLVAALAHGATLLFAHPASAQYAPPPVEPPPPPVQYRHPSWRVAGIVMTSIGAASLISAAVVIGLDQTVWSKSCSDSCGVLSFAVGLPLGLVGLGLVGPGIPLWVVGSLPPKQPPPAVPSVAAGPRSVTLRWAF
jgi:hypothetical protein